MVLQVGEDQLHVVGGQVGARLRARGARDGAEVLPEDRVVDVASAVELNCALWCAVARGQTLSTAALRTDRCTGQLMQECRRKRSEALLVKRRGG